MPQQKIQATHVARDCIAVRLRMADRVITKIYDDALRPYGLRINQFAMLAMSEARGGLRQADICAELQIDNSTLSRNLDRMRASGWMKECPGEDRRERLHKVTGAGRRLLNQAIPAWDEAQKKSRELLGGNGIDALWEFARSQGVE